MHLILQHHHESLDNSGMFDDYMSFQVTDTIEQQAHEVEQWEYHCARAVVPIHI